MEAFIHDCKIFYRYEKNDKKDTVVFLHGWGCDGSIFSFFENEITKHASALLVDFPGHGHSEEPREPWGVPEYAEQLKQLLLDLNITRAFFIAHSFGGRVAVWLASHYPEMVEKLVITGGAGIRKSDSGKSSRRQLQYKKLKKAVNLLSMVPFLKSFSEGLQERLVQKYGSPDYKRLSPNMRKTFVKVINQDLSEHLSSISAPTLLVWGSSDTETPLWMGQKMEKEIPDAGLIVFDGRTHFAFLEEAQRFLLIINSFFWEGTV